VSNLNLKFKSKYGLDIWPAQLPLHQIDLMLAKKFREYPFNQGNLLNPVSEHLLRAITELFTRDQIVVHPWLETMARSWCLDETFHWWGAAGSTKSANLGLFALLDYVTDPNETFAILASTSRDMLMLRSFGFIIQYLGYLKSNGKFQVPFRYHAQSCSIIPDGLAEDEQVRCRLKGVAVKQGTTEDARTALQGVHTKYVRLLLDELEGMREAAIDARTNLSQAPYFKLGTACNIESLNGLAGKYGKPKDREVILTEAITEWDAVLGRTYRFDAFKSPGIEKPDLFPFLPTQKSIDRIIEQNQGNADAPAVWTFLRALPPPQQSDRTVLTESQLRSYRMLEPVVWRSEAPMKGIAIDPAFTADGDDAVAVVFEVGMSTDGIMTLSFCDPVHYLQILASSDKPVIEQVADQVVQLAEDEGVGLHMIGIDDSGTQSLADVIEMKMGTRGIYRTNFGTRAPDIPVSATNFELASKRYKNRITWLYYTIAELGARSQIRNLPETAAVQFCKRRIDIKMRPLTMESKTEHKKRLAGKSPDEADACAIAVGLARERLGLMPGQTEFTPSGPEYAYTSTGATNTEWVNKVNNLSTSYGSSGTIR